MKLCFKLFLVHYLLVNVVCQINKPATNAGTKKSDTPFNPNLPESNPFAAPVSNTENVPLNNPSAVPVIKTSDIPVSKRSAGRESTPSVAPISKTLDAQESKANNEAKHRVDPTIKPSGKSSTKYNLLCFLPAPVKSHQKLLEPLLRELSSRGHSLTLVTPMPLTDPPENLEQVVVADQYAVLEEIIAYGKGQGMLARLNIAGMNQAHINYATSLATDPVFQMFLQEDRHFDGIIMCVMMNDIFVTLHHRYNAPIIEVLPLGQYHWSYYLLGIPYDTSYIVDTMVPFTDHMTFAQRLQNTFVSMLFRGMGEYMMSSSQQMMDQYIRYPGWEERPSHREMIQNISLVLINTHPTINFPYPLPPHAKEIAGANITPRKPLPKDLQEFMDSATHGVILVSMGSHIDMEKILGPEKSDIFLKFFSRIKQKVLWKWNSEIKNVSSNIKTTNWLPQNDVLAHNNCRLFLSHCGYHSSVEAIYHSVPIIAIPVQGDQNKNTAMMEHFGIAVRLDLNNITFESLSWSVNEVLSNKRYKENAEKRSKIFRDQKATPLETAIYWTEYVLRHNGAHHLKPAVISMPWYQHALIDVYAAILISIITPVITIYYVFKCLCKSCRKVINVKKIKRKINYI